MIKDPSLAQDDRDRIQDDRDYTWDDRDYTWDDMIHGIDVCRTGSHTHTVAAAFLGGV